MEWGSLKLKAREEIEKWGNGERGGEEEMRIKMEGWWEGSEKGLVMKIRTVEGKEKRWEPNKQSWLLY